MPNPRANTWHSYVSTLVLSINAPLAAQFVELAQPRRVPTFPYPERQLVAADLDRDRDLDLVTLADDRVLVLRNDGLGIFDDVTPLNVAQGWWPWAAAAGDLDGDLDVDLVLARNGRGSVYLNDGRGGFVESGGPPYVDLPTAVHLADVDGDGDLDILDAVSSFQPIRLWRNDGRASFAPDTTSLPTTAIRVLLAVIDVENDGDPDAIVFDGAVNSVWINDGIGRFTDQPTRLAGLATAALAPGDVDGDGDLDLVTATFSQARAGVFVNDGRGFFAIQGGRLPATAFGVPTLGDADADGDLDVVFAGYVSPSLQIVFFHNDGRGFFTDVTATHMTPRSGAANVVFADFDGDRDADLVVPGTPSRFYAGSPDGRLTSDDAPEISAGIGRGLGVGVGPIGDIDGDHDADMVTGTGLDSVCFNGGENWLARNDGLGRFTTEQLPSPSEPTSRVRLVDLDRDGDLDLLEANSPYFCHWYLPGGYEYAYFNDGRGRFTMVTLGGPQNTTYDIAAADVDGDGDEDVLVANGPGSDTGQNRLYLNRGGTRGFDDATPRLPVDTDTTQLILVGDVDGDADLDMICVNAAQDRLYLNDGTGRFTDGTSGRMPTEGFAASAGALHDFDGDADLDLMLGGRWLYLNDGAGVFTDVTGGRMPPMPPYLIGNLGLLDAERDGDTDVIVGGRGVIRLLLNNAGVFTVASPSRFPMTDTSMAVTTGDLDADGDDDVLFATNYAPYMRAYLNLERQVYAPRLLQSGRPFALHFYARAGYASAPQTVIPFVGFDGLLPQPILVPDWGTFRLLLNPLVLLPPLYVPFPAGVVSIDLLVPRGLDATRLFVQALFLHSPAPADWHFSNALFLQR